MIREADVTDVAAIVELLVAATTEMGFLNYGSTQIPMRPRTYWEILGRMLSNKNFGLFVVEIGGKVAGVCAVELAPFGYNPNVAIAKEHIWHMHPGFQQTLKPRWYVKMLDHMIAWAKAHGATVFMAGAQPNSPASKLLQRRGILHKEDFCAGGI